MQSVKESRVEPDRALGLSEALGWACDRLQTRLRQAGKGACLQTPLREAVPVDGAIEPLWRWLARQAGYPKFYWQSRDGALEVAALGIARGDRDQQAEARWAALEPSGCRQHYYWISGFDPTVEGWGDCPRQQLCLPRVELRREGDRLWLTLNRSATERPPALIASLRELDTAATAVGCDEMAPMSRRQDQPTLEQWRQIVARAQQQLRRGQLRKVVLARQTTLAAREAIDFWALFQRWGEAAARGYRIALQWAPQAGFVAFTPERLFRRDGTGLVTEALAGTLVRGEAVPPPIDEKNRHEHRLVAEELREKLRACGCTVETDEPLRLLPQGHIQHLYQPIRARLPNAALDTALLRGLHPTAAVGGLPAAAARAFIAEQEGFERGWYAGCCGLVSAQRSELAIGIRSGRIEGDRLHLYAGAGIVPGSDAEHEWRELEAKIAVPLKLFGGGS